MRKIYPNGAAARQSILDFMGDYQTIYGRPPTIREIGEGVMLSSSSTVAAHLKHLVAVGKVKRIGRRGETTRCYTLAESGPAHKCPKCGCEF